MFDMPVDNARPTGPDRTMSMLDRMYQGGEWELKENADGSFCMEWEASTAAGPASTSAAAAAAATREPSIDLDSLATDSYSISVSFMTDKQPWCKEVRNKSEVVYELLHVVSVHIVVFRHRKNGELGRIGDACFHAPLRLEDETVEGPAQEVDTTWCQPLLKVLDNCNCIAGWNTDVLYHIMRAHHMATHQRTLYWQMKTVDVFDTIKKSKFVYPRLADTLQLNDIQMDMPAFPVTMRDDKFLIERYLTGQTEALLQLHYVLYRRPDHHVVYLNNRLGVSGKHSTHTWVFPAAREALFEEASTAAVTAAATASCSSDSV